MRAHRTLDRLPDPRAGPRRAGRRARPERLIIGGSTSVLPADAETRRRLPPGLPEHPRAEGQRRAVGHRHQRRRQRPPRHRRLLARPDHRRRPQGPRLHEDRPRRRLRDHEHKNPISNLSQQEVEGIFTGKIRDWSEVPGREGLRPDRPVRPRRRLRYPGRLPAHLPRRIPEDRRRARLPSPPTAWSRLHVDKDEHGDRLRVLRLHRRRQRRRLPGRRLQPAQRHVRPVRGRA